MRSGRLLNRGARPLSPPLGGHLASPVRIPLVLSVGLICLCGCCAHEHSVQLKALVEGMERAWPRSAADLKLSVTARKTPDLVLLHCRLENVSTHAVELNGSHLPWNTPGFFMVAVLDAEGRVTPADGRMIVPSKIPKALTMAAGAVLEGDFDPKYLRIVAPRADVALVWWYTLDLMGPGTSFVDLSGVTFLPQNAR